MKATQKNLIDPIILKFWTVDLLKEKKEVQKKILFKAAADLKKEIKKGILKDIKYLQELNLLIELKKNYN